MNTQRGRPRSTETSEDLASIDKQIAYLAKAEARLAEAIFYERVATTLRSVTSERTNQAA